MYTHTYIYFYDNEKIANKGLRFSWDFHILGYLKNCLIWAYIESPLVEDCCVTGPRVNV